MDAIPSAESLTVVILASGTGSLASALLDAVEDDEYPATVAAVVSDRECAALKSAERRGVPTTVVPMTDDRAEWDRALADTVAGHQPDLVVSAGFMRILGADFLARFGGRIINAHPALLPSFPGAHAVPAALAHGVKVTGSTIHLVDEGVDTGPILAQAPVAVNPADDEITLHERIKMVERVLLVAVVRSIAIKGVVIEGRKAYIP
ncbi:phosphoribosylglycinamide formyltransferase [Williamsia sp. 1135]|uniref:phosphoribosylglycinamide formyltransferase n=1 Tax=Williamsia sp. 1135 TaxID=1889262 RepID=UPI001F0B273B|nr:phosphoribosylglycinamide formyltransferase [Williamsia sp. 1135]